MKTVSTILCGAVLTCISMSVSAHFIGVGGNNSIDGSLCVGFDCVAEEAFGFQTLRLKENNLRLHFDDTSVAASFPNNDWKLIANDSANGGGNYFAIQDDTAARKVFVVEAGARTNALYVDSGGDVGVGTSNPVTELHLVRGDTPTLRLEQDGTSGFTPQTWDVAGNETNFFVRDVTNGSQLPFRIRPDAPTNSIFVDTDGEVGLGTASPAAELHVRDTSGSGAQDMLMLENNGNPELVLINTNNSKEWVMSGGLNYVIKGGVGGIDTTLSTLTDTGDLTIIGELTTGGTTCGGGGCDMVFSPETTIETIEEHALQMWSNSYLPAVGPTVENMPINLSAKTGGILNELEKAHIYIEQLHQRQVQSELMIQQLQKENQATSVRYDAQLDQLKAMLIDLQISTQSEGLLTSTN